jgi:hypothetical protein
MSMKLKESCRRRSSSRCEMAYGTERGRLFSRNVRRKTDIQSLVRGYFPTAIGGRRVRENVPLINTNIHSNVFEPIVGDIMWISFAALRYFEVKEFDRFERKNPHDKDSEEFLFFGRIRSVPQI